MELGTQEHLDYCAQQADSCRIATSDESLTVMDRVGAQIGELDWMAAIEKECLQVAAPDMYMALKMIDGLWSEDFEGPDNDRAIDRFTDRTLHTWRMVRGALAKAECRNV